MSLVVSMPPVGGSGSKTKWRCSSATLHTVLILLIYWMVTEAYSALLAAGISTIAVAPGSNCDDEHLRHLCSSAPQVGTYARGTVYRLCCLDAGPRGNHSVILALFMFGSCIGSTRPMFSPMARRDNSAVLHHCLAQLLSKTRVFKRLLTLWIFSERASQTIVTYHCSRQGLGGSCPFFAWDLSIAFRC